MYEGIKTLDEYPKDQAKELLKAPPSPTLSEHQPTQEVAVKIDFEFQDLSEQLMKTIADIRVISATQDEIESPSMSDASQIGINSGVLNELVERAVRLVKRIQGRLNNLGSESGDILRYFCESHDLTIEDFQNLLIFFSYSKDAVMANLSHQSEDQYKSITRPWLIGPGQLEAITIPITQGLPNWISENNAYVQIGMTIKDLVDSLGILEKYTTKLPAERINSFEIQVYYKKFLRALTLYQVMTRDNDVQLMTKIAEAFKVHKNQLDQALERFGDDQKRRMEKIISRPNYVYALADTAKGLAAPPNLLERTKRYITQERIKLGQFNSEFSGHPLGLIDQFKTSIRDLRSLYGEASYLEVDFLRIAQNLLELRDKIQTSMGHLLGDLRFQVYLQVNEHETLPEDEFRYLNWLLDNLEMTIS